MDEMQAALLVGNVLLRLHTCAALMVLERLALDIRPIASELVRADGLGAWTARLRSSGRSIDAQLLDPDSSPVDAWSLAYRTWLLTPLKNDSSGLHQAIVELDSLASRLAHTPQRKRTSGSPCDLFDALIPIRNKAFAHAALGLDFWRKAVPTVSTATDWLLRHSPLWQCELCLPLSRPSGPVVRVLSGASPIESRPIDPLPDGRPRLAFNGEFVGALPDLVSIDPVDDQAYFANGAFVERDATAEFLCEAIEAAEPGADRRRMRIEAYALVPDVVRSETEGRASLQLGQAGVFHNLPPRPEGFVSRGEVEANLWKRLADANRRHLLTVRGIGGIGKTSLILELCHRLTEELDPSPYEYVVWLSARDIDLTLEGPRRVRRATSSLEEVWSRVCALFDLGRDPNRRDAFERELASAPILLILDNFETYDDQRTLFAYLNEVIAPPSKAVITSRHVVPGESDLELSGMDLAQARELLTREARRLNREPLMTDPVMDEIYRGTHGHPYAMKLAAARFTTAGATQKAIKGALSDEQVLEALFRRSFDDLGSSEAEFVFLLIGEFPGGVSEDALRVACHPHEIDVDAALGTLQLRSLVEAIAATPVARFDMPTMAREFCRSRLIKGHLLQGAIEAAAAFLQRFPELVVGDWHSGAQKLESAVTERSERSTEAARALASLEVLAETHRTVWVRVAHARRALGRPEHDWSEAYKRAVEEAPGRSSVLLEWSNLATDPDTQIRLKVQAVAAEPENVELAVLVARFLNRWYADKPRRYSDLEWHGLIQPVATALERHVDSLGGDGLSNLAWLYLHDGRQRERAERIVDLGLEREPENRYLKALTAGGRARFRTTGSGGAARAPDVDESMAQGATPARETAVSASAGSSAATTPQDTTPLRHEARGSGYAERLGDATARRRRRRSSGSPEASPRDAAEVGPRSANEPPAMPSVREVDKRGSASPHGDEVPRSGDSRAVEGSGKHPRSGAGTNQSGADKVWQEGKARVSRLLDLGQPQAAMKALEVLAEKGQIGPGQRDDARLLTLRIGAAKARAAVDAGQRQEAVRLMSGVRAQATRWWPNVPPQPIRPTLTALAELARRASQGKEDRAAEQAATTLAWARRTLVLLADEGPSTSQGARKARS
ncbi:MAG: hypothetical protein AB7I38_17505 [Dehalococcoidia bacterium]